MACGETFARIILSIFNSIFLLASGLMLAFGITAKVNPSAIQTIFNYILPEGTRGDLQNAGVNLTGIAVSSAVFMIIVGVVGIVIAGVGFFGACCLVRWMLVVYAVLMILLLLGEIALIVFAAVYTDTFKTVIQKGMKDTLVNSFRNDIRIYANGSVMLPTDPVELAWTNTQLKAKCCGAYNYTDYASFAWTNTGLTPTQTNPAVVPISCCLQYSNSTYPPKSGSFFDVDGCLNGVSASINQQNCYESVSADIHSFIQNYKGIAIGIAAGIVAIELILIIFSCIACRKQSQVEKFV